MVEKTVLANGIRIVTETVPAVHSVSIGIWIKAGSRNERDAEHGISHFIEHMLFKGTARHTAAEIARLIDSVGGVLNAFTTKEYTCFYVKVLRQHLDLAIGLLCEIFFESRFQPEEIEKERNVVIQEINMVKDTPDDYVQDLFNQAFFCDHPLGRPILGDMASVQRFSRDDLTGYFGREYPLPDRIIISAAGSITHAELCAAIAGRFERVQGSGVAAAPVVFQPRRSIGFHHRKLEQVHVCIGTAGLSQTDPARFTLYPLNAILGGSMSSRLFQEIRENRGLAYAIYSFMVSFSDTGVFGIYMGVVKDTIQEALRVALLEVARLRDGRVSVRELAEVKEQIKGNILLSLESTDSRMSRLAKCELYYSAYVPLEEVVANIDAVTSDDLQDLARRLFRDELCIYTFLGPVKSKNIPEGLLRIA